MPVRDPVFVELMAVLKAIAPYALESARRHERLGLEEEAAAARAIHSRAQWALRSAGDNASAAARFHDTED